jgi:hypothetical protein
MMMGMLEAGGLKLLADEVRRPDLDNPNGYFEFAPAKRISRDQTWLPLARGKGVKIISLLLPNIPPSFVYKVIFMRRALPEILASQQRMLRRSGENTRHDDDEMAQLYERHLRNIEAWLAAQTHIDVLFVDYADALSNPMETARRVKDFLDRELNLNAMAGSIIPKLHRQRALDDRQA